LIHFVPRDNIVQEAESVMKTVIEYSPSSSQAKNYDILSDKIKNNTFLVIPTPMQDDELEQFYFSNINL
jgi:nitrogenase iron protein NifH